MADAVRWLSVTLRLRILQRLVLVLLATLVLTQTLGVLHRVAHAHSKHAVVTTQVDFMAETVPGELSSGFFKRLWGEHSSLAECQLFDQACPDLVHVVSLAMVVLPVTPVWTLAVLQERFALFERFYAARGPPVAP